jgi:hypothetical protein
MSSRKKVRLSVLTKRALTEPLRIEAGCVVIPHHLGKESRSWGKPSAPWLDVLIDLRLDWIG